MPLPGRVWPVLRFPHAFFHSCFSHDFPPWIAYTKSDSLFTRTHTYIYTLSGSPDRFTEHVTLHLLLLRCFAVDGLKMVWLRPKSNWEELQEEKKGKKKARMCVCSCTKKRTYWYEKLLDLFQCVTHPGVGLSWRGKHLDEDVQVLVQVVIFGLATLPKLFFLLVGRKKKKVCYHISSVWGISTG